MSSLLPGSSHPVAIHNLCGTPKPVRTSCYEVASLNENQAKKLCRKQPTQLIAYARPHVIRTYPAGMRIDSSNFNPLVFWTFGIQMVALNYQTTGENVSTVYSRLHSYCDCEISDIPMAINSAMFEQNGNAGYLLKPRVMWDPKHPGFNRFNPWNKKFSGISAVHLTLTVAIDLIN